MNVTEFEVTACENPELFACSQLQCRVVCIPTYLAGTDKAYMTYRIERWSSGSFSDHKCNGMQMM